MPAPPPYGASSTLRCRPIPHSRRSCVRIVASPRSWIRPGMLAAERRRRSSPGTASGRRSRAWVMDGCGRSVASAPGSAGGPSVPGSAASAGVARPSGGGRASGAAPSAGLRQSALRRRQVERLDVDDDLAAARREDPDEVPDGRARRTRRRPAVDEEHLGAARAVDVRTVPSSAPSTSRTAVPTTSCQKYSPRGSSASGRRRRPRGTRRGASSAAARVVDLRELQAPARTVADGRRPVDGQRVVDPSR